MIGMIERTYDDIQNLFRENDRPFQLYLTDHPVHLFEMERKWVETDGVVERKENHWVIRDFSYCVVMYYQEDQPFEGCGLMELHTTGDFYTLYEAAEKVLEWIRPAAEIVTIPLQINQELDVLSKAIEQGDSEQIEKSKERLRTLHRMKLEWEV